MRSLLSSSGSLRLAGASALALLLACSDNDDTVLREAGAPSAIPHDETSANAAAQPSLGEAGAAELDGYVVDALARYQVPGAAVAVVRGPDLLYQGMFGVRGLDDPQPITPDTLFAVGSVSKSMTTCWRRRSSTRAS